MKTKLFLTIILITASVPSFSQKKKDQPTKEDFKELQKRAGAEGELIAVEPKLLDEFIEAVQKSDINKVYNMADDDVKRIQTKDDMSMLFKLYDKYYGKILTYDQTTISMKNQPSFGQYATAGYDVIFEKYKGKGMSMFKVYGEDTIKMVSFVLGLVDYSTVAEFDSIAKPTLNAIKSKDGKGIYSLTSARFKEYTSIANFESGIKPVLELDLDLSALKMYRHQLGVREGNELLAIYYELKDKAGHLQLTFTKQTDKFELEGLFYTPKD